MRSVKMVAASLAVGIGSAAMAEAPENGVCDMADGRYERGQSVVDRLSQTSPDIARYVIEYPYGDIFCRPGLSDQQRQLAIISALAALGYAQPELQVHIHGALNVGVSREEVIEAMILISVYAGFPASLHGIRAAEAVFAERDAAGQEDTAKPKP